MINVKKIFRQISTKKQQGFSKIIGYSTSRAKTLEYLLLAVLVKAYMQSKKIAFGTKNLKITSKSQQDFLQNKVSKNSSLQEVNDLIAQIGEDEFDETYYAGLIANLFANETILYENAIKLLLSFTLEAGPLNQIDVLCVRKIADTFSLPEKFLDDEFKAILLPTQTDPYKLFGLNKHSVTLKQLRSAYVEMVKEYHPDKFVQIYYPKAFQAILTVRMSRISDAFYAIKKEKSKK